MSEKTNITGLFDVSGNLTVRAMEKYLHGELSMAEKEIVQKHLDGSEFDREAMEGFQKISPAQVNSEIKALQAEIKQMAEKTPKTGLIRSLKRTYWYAAAAIVVLFGVTALIIFMVRGPVIQTQLAVIQPDTTFALDEEPIQEDQKQAISENKAVPVTQQVTRINIVEDDAYAVGEALTEVTEVAEVDEVLVNDDIIVDADLIVDDKFVGSIEARDETVHEEYLIESKMAAPESSRAMSKMAMDSNVEMEEDQLFMVVERMPEFPGGEKALSKFLAENITYPQMAKESGIHGRVYVTFIVEQDGSINDVQVLRGIGGGCDEEAIRVVKAMPKWIPGKQRGKPVRVQYNLPVKFSLE